MVIVVFVVVVVVVVAAVEFMKQVVIFVGKLTTIL
jgi:hypothetical protein